MEVDKEKPEDSKNQTPVSSNQPTPQQQQAQQPPGQGQQPGAPSQQSLKDAAPQIDLLLEASKLPLDVAIFNSTRAAGGDDKIRKYLQAVLVVGGTGLTPGMAHALESRCAFVYLSFSFSFLLLHILWGGAEWGMEHSAGCIMI
jgi:actin-related protein 8